MRSFVTRLASLRVSGSVSLTMDVGSGIGRLILSNPSRRNALSGPMMVQLKDAICELEQWESGTVLILSGDGGHFCAGADLESVREAIDTPRLGALMSQLMSETLNRMRQVEKQRNRRPHTHTAAAVKRRRRFNPSAAVSTRHLTRTDRQPNSCSQVSHSPPLFPPTVSHSHWRVHASIVDTSLTLLHAKSSSFWWRALLSMCTPYVSGISNRRGLF